jgi:hypothetical protein
MRQGLPRPGTVLALLSRGGTRGRSSGSAGGRRLGPGGWRTGQRRGGRVGRRRRGLGWRGGGSSGQRRGGSRDLGAGSSGGLSRGPRPLGGMRRCRSGLCGAGAGWARVGRRGRCCCRTNQEVRHQSQCKQRDQQPGRPPGTQLHEVAAPDASTVSSSIGTWMPSRRSAAAIRPRSASPTRNCLPGRVRATTRTWIWSTSML